MAHTRQPQIDALQQLRHRLLLERTKMSGHAVAVIDMQLNMVRSELHALYAQKHFSGGSCAANDLVYAGQDAGKSNAAFLSDGEEGLF